MRNKNLQKAKERKNDEFYTPLDVIENELQYYDFDGKVVYCNCDNPSFSNFYFYFRDNFEKLGIQKLICTFINDNAYKLEFSEVGETRTALKDNGDFRSGECVEILKECDVVVTNPPFSLFRELVGLLFEYDKKFLIMGHLTASDYKLLREPIGKGDVTFGTDLKDRSITFKVPTEDEYVTISNTRWFTNMKFNKTKPFLKLDKKYNPAEYPKYDDVDAIAVSKVKDIPYDYNGAMGVPITFLDKHNPEQFRILGFCNGPILKGKQIFKRIIIKKNQNQIIS